MSSFRVKLTRPVLTAQYRSIVIKAKGEEEAERLALAIAISEETHEGYDTGWQDGVDIDQEYERPEVLWASKVEDDDVDSCSVSQ